MRKAWLVWGLPVLVSAVLFCIPASAYAATDTVAPEPILVVKSYKTTPSPVTAGAQFKLEISIDNVSEADARNLTVSAGTAAVSTTSMAGVPPAYGASVIVLGVNTRFVGDVPANTANKTVTFEMVANEQGPPGGCSVPVTLAYDTAQGRRTVLQSVGFLVTRTLVFDVTALEYPRAAIVGTPFTLSATVANTNDFPVKNITLRFTSDSATLRGAETTVALLEAGKTAKLSTEATPLKAGSFKATLVISYKDDFGQTKEIRREVMVSVEAGKADDLGISRPRQQPRPSIATQVVTLIKAFFGLGG